MVSIIEFLHHLKYGLDFDRVLINLHGKWRSENALLFRCEKIDLHFKICLSESVQVIS